MDKEKINLHHHLLPTNKMELIHNLFVYFGLTSKVLNELLLTFEKALNINLINEGAWIAERT